MKKISFCLLLACSVWLMYSCNNQPGKPAVNEDEMINAAKALDAKFMDGMNNKNLDAVMSCYWNSPDLTVYPPGELEQKGHEAVKASFAKFFSSPTKAKHELTEANYKVNGEVVYGWGKVKLTISGDDSTHAPMVLEGRYTEVIAQKDSQWVYILDHASVPLPEPAAPTEEAKK